MKVKIKHLFAGFAILSSLLIFGCTQLQDSLSSSNDDETTTSSTSSGESGKTSRSVTLTGNSTHDLILESSDFSSSLNISEISVKMKTGEGATITGTGNWWFCLASASSDGYICDLSWSDGGYSASITETDKITAIKSNGLYVYGNVSGSATFTITITYTE